MGHTSTHESPIPCLRASEHCSEWGTRKHTNHPSLVSGPRSTAVSGAHINTRITHPLSPGLRALQPAGDTSTHESPIPCLRASEHCSEWGTHQHTNHPSLVSGSQSTAASWGHVNTRITPASLTRMRSDNQLFYIPFISCHCFVNILLFVLLSFQTVAHNKNTIK